LNPLGFSGAPARSRTADLLITNQLLLQLDSLGNNTNSVSIFLINNHGSANIKLDST